MQEHITTLRDSKGKEGSKNSRIAHGWKKKSKSSSAINGKIDDPCPVDDCGGPTTSIRVGPLINTRWGQGCGYNDFTPSKSRGSCGHAPAGCGPVAVAQVMRHHRNRFGTMTYNGVPIDFSDASMPLNPNPNAPGNTPDIARLMRFIGD